MNAVLITDRSTQRDVFEHRVFDSRLTIQFSNNGKFAILIENESILLAWLEEGTTTRIQMPKNIGYTDLALSADDRYLFIEMISISGAHRKPSGWYDVNARAWIGSLYEHGFRSMGALRVDRRGRYAVYVSTPREEEKRQGLTDPRTRIMIDQRGQRPQEVEVPFDSPDGFYVNAFTELGRSFIVEYRQRVFVFEVASQRVRWEIPFPDRTMDSGYSPDGRSVFVCGQHEPILEFAYWQWLEPGTPQENDWPEHWERLASDDAKLAFNTMRELAHHPAYTLKNFRTLQPPSVPSDNELAAYILRLMAPESAERVAGLQELRKIMHTCREPLEKMARTHESAEVREVLQQLLREPISGESVRWSRVVEICEILNTPEAKELLSTWASTPTPNTLREEARWALRMK
jgi:hypothetical protein